MYKIQIDHVIDNPDYQKQKEEYDMRKHWSTGAFMAEPSSLISIHALTVDLTDEEFRAIKKAVLEVM